MLASPLVEAVLAAKDEISVEMATTPELIREAYRLRHQVYCVENDYEPGRDGLEFDEFDRHSRHVLIRRNSTEEVVGTVRLVLPRLDSPKEALPMLKVCDPAILRHVPLGRAGELSRFAISKARRGMSNACIAVMRLGLIQGCLRLSMEAGHTHLIAIMEPSLLRLLRATGAYLQPAGPLVNYHGWRQPTSANWSVLLDRMARERPEVWDFVTEGGRWWGNSGVDDRELLAA